MSDDKPDLSKDLEAQKAENAALKAELEKLKAAQTPPPEKPEDINSKADDDRRKKQAEKDEAKARDAAVRFNMSADKFLADNKSFLPDEVSDIFTTANKETYDSEVERSNDIKAGVVKEFFKVQANLDLLTPGQKTQLEDYLKLSNTGRQEKASQIYESIFEPTLETIRRVKKAEALNKGYGTGGFKEDAYKTKMRNLSNKHYGIGER